MHCNFHFEDFFLRVRNGSFTEEEGYNNGMDQIRSVKTISTLSGSKAHNDKVDVESGRSHMSLEASSIDDTPGCHRRNENTMREVLDRTMLVVDRLKTNFDYNKITLAFTNIEDKIRFERYMILQQHPWSLIVGLAFPSFAILLDYSINLILLYHYGNVPLSLVIIGLFIAATVGVLMWVYVSKIRICTEEFHNAALKEVQFRHRSDYDTLQGDVESIIPTEVTEGHHNHHGCETEISFTSHEKRFGNIYSLGLSVLVAFISYLGFFGIVQAIYLDCGKGCMISSVPMHNLVWVAIWYLPMHAVHVGPITWLSILAVEFYSKLMIFVIFYIYGGMAIFAANSQVLFAFAWLWLTWMAAMYHMYKRQMVIFIQREQLMTMVAREKQQSIARNLLWII